MIVIECDQGSPEWFEARSGAITASMFSEVRKRLKSGANKGDFTTAAHNYAFKLAVERIKGGPAAEDQFETFAMGRGKELEVDARFIHERRLGGVFIEQAGVILTDDRKFGFSTDGFIGDDGVSEYKAFFDGTKVRGILFDQSSDDVIDQVQGGLWISGREWCDFCLYYPDLESVGLDLIVNRIHRDEDYIDALTADLLEFDRLVESYIERINTLAAKHGGPAAESCEEAELEGIF